MEEVTHMFNRWKEWIEQRGLELDEEYTKSMVTGNKARERIQAGRWPCGCCGRGVGSNSVLYAKFSKCFYK